MKYIWNDNTYKSPINLPIKTKIKKLDTKYATLGAKQCTEQKYRAKNI